LSPAAWSLFQRCFWLSVQLPQDWEKGLARGDFVWAHCSRQWRCESSPPLCFPKGTITNLWWHFPSILCNRFHIIPSVLCCLRGLPSVSHESVVKLHFFWASFQSFPSSKHGRTLAVQALASTREAVGFPCHIDGRHCVPHIHHSELGHNLQALCLGNSYTIRSALPVVLTAPFLPSWAGLWFCPLLGFGEEIKVSIWSSHLSQLSQVVGWAI
jgi:hypothetical protein